MIGIMLVFLISCTGKPRFSLNVNEIQNVEVTSFDDFGKSSEQILGTIDLEEDVKFLIDSINRAERISGDVDMPRGDYNLNINYQDGRVDVFHVWLPEKDALGIVMNQRETVNAYEWNRTITEKIRQMIIRSFRD